VRSDDPNSVRRGEAAVRERSIPPKEQNVEFPILLDDGQISTSTSESTIYADFKPATVGVVLIDPEKRKEAQKWLLDHKQQILSDQMELGV